MGLVELILTVCSVVQPAACEEQHLTFVENRSLMQCMLEAPPKIAEWSETHPGRRVVKWTCRFPGADGKEI